MLLSITTTTTTTIIIIIKHRRASRPLVDLAAPVTFHYLRNDANDEIARARELQMCSHRGSMFEKGPLIAVARQVLAAAACEEPSSAARGSAAFKFV